MNYFLGVDGGQSSTTAVIGDENGRTVGWATAGPCNHVAAPEARAKFLRVMRECIGQAASRAGIEAVENRWPFHSACFGMSGGIEDKAPLLHELLISEHIQITHDAMIALAGLDAETGLVMLLYLDNSYERFRAQGQMRNKLDLWHAVHDGAVKRIRPKTMTVAAAFIGLVPLLWATGTGADVMRRLAAPMLGGLATSFLMELLIYPVIFYIAKGWRLPEAHHA